MNCIGLVFLCWTLGAVVAFFVDLADGNGNGNTAYIVFWWIRFSKWLAVSFVKALRDPVQ